MRKFNFGRHRDRSGNDGAALIVAAICGLAVCLFMLASAVDAITPIVQQQLTPAVAVAS